MAGGRWQVAVGRWQLAGKRKEQGNGTAEGAERGEKNELPRTPRGNMRKVKNGERRTEPVQARRWGAHELF